MKLGSFYRSTVETLIEALVSGVAPLKGRNSRNQAGEGIGIMREVSCTGMPKLGSSLPNLGIHLFVLHLFVEAR